MKSNNFLCYKCGKCCYYNDEMTHTLLLPSDIEMISKKFRLSFYIFFLNFCSVIKKNVSGRSFYFPVLRRNVDKCIFLENDLCLIQNFKPILCELLPIDAFYENLEWFKFDCVNHIYVSDEWNTEIIDFTIVNEWMAYQNYFERLYNITYYSINYIK